MERGNITMQEIKEISGQFENCRKVLTAIGNETRLHLLLVMMNSGKCGGVRVGEIAKQTNLSRPAVSHHLQILKDAGIIKMRREATKNYYYIDADTVKMDELIRLFEHVKQIMKQLPDRSGEE